MFGSRTRTVVRQFDVDVKKEKNVLVCDVDNKLSNALLASPLLPLFPTNSGKSRLVPHKDLPEVDGNARPAQKLGRPPHFQLISRLSLGSQCAANNDAHYVVGALQNLVNAHIAHVALNVVVGEVAVSTV